VATVLPALMHPLKKRLQLDINGKSFFPAGKCPTGPGTFWHRAKAEKKLHPLAERLVITVRVLIGKEPDVTSTTYTPEN